MSPSTALREKRMTPPVKKGTAAFHLAMGLFTIIAIPIIIALPFLLYGFIGRS